MRSSIALLQFGFLDRNILFKKNYKISLKTKLMSKIVRNAAVHDNNNNWTCNNFEMEEEKLRERK